MKHLLAGAVESRSETGRVYQPRILLQANFLCPCNGSVMRDSICAHLQELVNSMPIEELRAWIYDAQVVPREVSAPANE